VPAWDAQDGRDEPQRRLPRIDRSLTVALTRNRESRAEQTLRAVSIYPQTGAVTRAVTTGSAIGHERRQLLLVAIVTLVPFALLAVWARFYSPAEWEPGVLNALAAQHDLVGAVTTTLNTLGNLEFWAVIVADVAAALAVVRGIVAGLLVGLSFASDLAAFAVKIVVERARPETAAAQQFFGADDFSYPSGHTVRAAALVAVTIWLLAPPRWRIPAAVSGGLLAGALMGFARVSLGVHWPTDIFGGTLLGLAWFAVTAALFLPLLQERRKRQRTNS
jgi:membrane-associated phospholipid phosphatase